MSRIAKACPGVCVWRMAIGIWGLDDPSRCLGSHNIYRSWQFAVGCVRKFAVLVCLQNFVFSALTSPTFNGKKSHWFLRVELNCWTTYLFIGIYKCLFSGFYLFEFSWIWTFSICNELNSKWKKLNLVISWLKEKPQYGKWLTKVKNYLRNLCLLTLDLYYLY